MPTDGSDAGSQEVGAASADVWRRRFERERAARKEAERLLEEKTREVYLVNEQLRSKADDLQASLTELHDTQDALVERAKMAALGDLVAGVAHEVNTPIGVAVTAASYGLEEWRALARPPEGSDEEDHYLEIGEALEMVLANLRRAATLVQGFRQVAVDQSSGDLRTVALDRFVDEIVTSLRPMVKSARASVRTDMPTGLTVQIAAGEFAQVITNLIQNACVHAFDETIDDRTIHLAATDEGDALTLTCRDGGVGMPPHVAARVFDPFFTTRRGSGGSGLGMHLVRAIVVERFRGTLTVDTAPGSGAAWHLHLPFTEEALRREAFS